MTPLRGFFLGMALGAITGLPWLALSGPGSRAHLPPAAITTRLP